MSELFSFRLILLFIQGKNKAWNWNFQETIESNFVALIVHQWAVDYNHWGFTI